MAARKVTPNAADRVTVTLDVRDREELTRLSSAQDRSLAWLVRDAVREYLTKHAEQGEVK